MDESLRNSRDDIANEPYNGPGKLITSAGYMYVSHALSMIAGFIGLGAMGAIAHGKTNAIKQWAENLSNTRSESVGVKKAAATAVAFVSENAEKLAHKIISGMKRVAGKRANGRGIGEERTAAFLFAGGFGAITGYIASSVWGLVKGSHEGEKGRRQFERAQAEIMNQREINGDLEKINDDLHRRFVESQTRDSADAAPVASSDKPGTIASAAKHEGVLAKAPQQEVA